MTGTERQRIVCICFAAIVALGIGALIGTIL